MNDMDEIAYWVYTKRAPCLMNYDNPVKKQKELGQTSKRYPSDCSVIEEVPSPKKKKRKISLLDDDGVSVSKQQNVYFEGPQAKQRQRTALSSCKSDTLESDVDFNIKNISIQDKPKKVKKQRNGRTLHKKNKIVTSTPLRRSLRKIHCVNNNEHLNVSYETYNCTAVNGSDVQMQEQPASKKSPTKAVVATKQLNFKEERGLQPKAKNQTVNGQFEDLSDVSGFTANYIRSTKLHSNSKPRRNLRNTSTRNLVKESQKPSQENNTTMLVCVNKSVNTTAEPPNTFVLNCSTDSSQNVINLITTKTNEKSVKVNQSTSLLKFVEVKTPKVKDLSSFGKVESGKLTSKTDVVDVSPQTKTSRYPKRLKPQSPKDVTVNSSIITRRASSSKRKVNAVEANSSYIKENTTESSLSRTRSKRNLTLAAKQVNDAVLVFNNSTEQTSSLNTLNVASQTHNDSVRSKQRPKRVPHKAPSGRAADKTALPQLKDSLREKSGFSACFSDSDDDNDALKQRKFFC